MELGFSDAITETFLPWELQISENNNTHKMCLFGKDGICFSGKGSSPCIKYIYMQGVYKANYVDVLPNMGKDSATYGENSAFCLETQGFPDAVNHKTFPTTILKANENYAQTTKYIFGINK